MLFSFFFQPVTDLAAAEQHYRDLGWKQTWQEGEHTVGLQMPGVETQLILDDSAEAGTAGPMYLVEDLGQWLEEHSELSAGPQVAIPGGRVTQISAPGHIYYVFSMDVAQE